MLLVESGSLFGPDLLGGIALVIDWSTCNSVHGQVSHYNSKRATTPSFLAPVLIGSS